MTLSRCPSPLKHHSDTSVWKTRGSRCGERACSSPGQIAYVVAKCTPAGDPATSPVWFVLPPWPKPKTAWQACCGSISRGPEIAEKKQNWCLRRVALKQKWSKASGRAQFEKVSIGTSKYRPVSLPIQTGCPQMLAPGRAVSSAHVLSKSHTTLKTARDRKNEAMPDSIGESL